MYSQVAADGAIHSSAIPTVLRDVRNEFLSASRAKLEYGVVVDTRTWRVDESATKALRVEVAASRGWCEVPKVQRYSVVASPVED